ncbi:MAG: hypothetical protein Q9168_000153 [Polycauliona sp. 1 TL-2023]
MATVAYWLQRQRKPDLQTLASHVGMKQYENLLKPELEVALDDYLRKNQNRLQSDPALSSFYKRLESPVKRERSSGNSVGGVGAASAVQEEVKKPKQRRQTIKAREELEQTSESEPQLPLTTTSPTSPRTPFASTPYSLARQLALPASPAVLADRIEESTTTITTSFANIYTTSPIPSTLSSLRSKLSTVTSIQLLTLFLEVFGLFRQTVPLKYLTTIPAIPALGLSDPTALKLPDLFALLTSAFWLPFALWLTTSVLLPTAGAWFMNLRSTRDEEGGFDPVTFGVVKGLVAWIVYVKGGVEGESKGVVEGSVPGGSVGMMVGAGVSVLGGLYDAVLKK